jgi:hypothetical protein
VCGGDEKWNAKCSSDCSGEEWQGRQCLHHAKKILIAWFRLKEANEALGWDALKKSEKKLGHTFWVEVHDTQENAVHPGED